MSLDINIFDKIFTLLKKAFFTLLLFFCCITAMLGQQFNTDDWQGHFSYNNIKSIAKGDGKIYAASENVIFTYDFLTNELETITTIEGLSGEYITSIHYSNNSNLLIIGYGTGLVEVYNLTTKSVLKVVDILNKTTISPENRRINHFYEHNNLVYISTNYGISVYNLEALEFGDTYYIGTNGTQVQVQQTVVFNNELYAATNAGLKKADLDNPNLIDFQFWDTHSLGNFLLINFVENNLYTIKSDNKLYEVVGSNLVPSLNFSESVVDLKSNDDHLIVATKDNVYRYESDLSLMDTFTGSAQFDTNFTTAQFVDETIYIGTEDFGILKSYANMPNAYEEIHPDGPLRNTPFMLKYGYGNLWVTFGDYDQNFNPHPLKKHGFSYFEDEKWHNITYDSIQDAIQKPVHNLNVVAINPINSNQIFISSFHNGILNFQKDNPMEFFDDTNSALQSLFVPSIPNYRSIRVSGLKFDEQGNLWSLTCKNEEPLKKYNPTTNQWQTYSFSSLIEDYLADENGFGALIIGPDGTKWIGSYQNGVIGFNENGNLLRQIKGEGTANLPINHIKALALDNNDVLWIGTYKGLRILYNTANFFTEEVISTEPIIILEDGLPKELLELQFITKIIVDGSNNKWISTVDAGVFYLSADGQKTIYHFTKNNSPLPSNSVTTMTQNENDGTIYFGTSRGLVSFKAGGSSPSDSLEDAFVYPNPVRPGFNLAIDKVKIKNLSENVNVKITDVTGNLVAEAQSNTNLRFKGYNLEIDGGTAYWNGKNLANNTVASGVYVVLISDLDNLETKVLKIMLVR